MPYSTNSNDTTKKETRYEEQSYQVGYRPHSGRRAIVAPEAFTPPANETAFALPPSDGKRESPICMPTSIEADAAGRLFDEIGPDLLQFARRRLATDSQTNEVVAITFAQLWQHPDSVLNLQASVRDSIFAYAENVIRSRWS